MKQIPLRFIHQFANGSWHAAAQMQVVDDEGQYIRDGDTVPLSGTIHPSFQPLVDQLNAFAQNELHASVIGERDTLKTQVAELTNERDSLQTELASANERIATLESRINELTAEPDIPIISRRQARLALLQMGLFEQVEQAVYTSPKGVQIEYEGETWRRDNPTLIAMAQALGMDEPQIDQFFGLAGTL